MAKIKHGFNRRGYVHRFYRIWIMINTRCNNPNRKDWKNYGGRGIKSFWPTFEGFRDDMLLSYQDGLSIDRIDNNGDYCKENCRWATQKEQMRNIRTNNLITYKNKTATIGEWAELLNLKYITLYRRIFDYKWPIEKAMTSIIFR